MSEGGRKTARGRPKGAQTVERSMVLCLPPACPSCGSTRREPYRDGPVRDQAIGGEIQGQRYNRILWHRTRCLDCGQALIVREFLYEPPPAGGK